jgi:DNA-binding HxlR family transcriptional regulator
MTPEPEMETTELMEACNSLKEIVARLNNTKRMEILKALPPGSAKTLEQLVVETNMPQSTLHGQLKELIRAGFIQKANESERPAKYTRTPFFGLMVSFASLGRNARKDDLGDRLKGYGQNDLIKLLANTS